jgi:hypothetical protein
MMERTVKPQVIIDKDGWTKVIIEEGFPLPAQVKDQTAFLNRERMQRYVDNHPERIYHYVVDSKEYTVDCKCSRYFIERFMREKGASDSDVAAAVDIGHQLQYFFGKMMVENKRAYGTLVGKQPGGGGILEHRGEELIDMFGRLMSVDEVHRIILQDWHYQISRPTIQAFYSRNLAKIEALRNAYEADYSDLALSKKRGRLDKLSKMFYTYYNKWDKDNRLEYARELRALLDQIKKEVEGEQIIVNVNGQINVDMTIEVNKTLSEAQRRVPVNNMILAMVAAKKGVDPTKLMTQLTTSYYRSVSGFGVYEPDKQLVHPVDLTYNWNEIKRKHRLKDKSVVIEDAKIVESTGRVTVDAEMNTIKHRLLELLDKDKAVNDKRKSGK